MYMLILWICTHEKNGKNKPFDLVSDIQWHYLTRSGQQWVSEKNQEDDAKSSLTTVAQNNFQSNTITET